METAKNINTETAATEDRTLSDELISKIIEREKAIAEHPDQWVTIDQLKKDMASI